MQEKPEKQEKNEQQRISTLSAAPIWLVASFEMRLFNMGWRIDDGVGTLRTAPGRCHSGRVRPKMSSTGNALRATMTTSQRRQRARPYAPRP
jgi:hypothetical protein